MKSAWGIVVAAVCAVAGTGCERKPVFDCGRPGASCGDTPGATCVMDRCAVPSTECPSGLVWDESAGELAGMCTPPEGGGADAGLNCGNGALDEGEACDGTLFGDKTCVGEGFAGGALACDGCALDTSGCTAPPGCSDGLIGPGEDCDGENLAGHSCESQGFFAGELGCTGACKFDLSMCTNCGNGTKNEGEACDMMDVGGQSCADVGMFEQGTLGCTAECALDTSACIHCGDGAAEGTESCDGMDLAGKDCAMLGFMGGTLGCNAASCTYDTSACVPFPNCPDGDIDPGEQCDGMVLGAGTCSTATGGLRPTGTLKCSAGCQYDTSSCYKCGDGVLHGAEVCDGTNFGADSCAARGFDGGTLTCAGTCLAVMDASCTDCGDGVKEGAETCDGSQLGGATCQSVGQFIGGTLQCNGSCNGFVTTMCQGPPPTPVMTKPMSGTYLGSHWATGTKRTTFEWQAVVLAGHTVTYDLQYGQDPTFTSGVVNVTGLNSTSYSMTSDFPNLSNVVPYGGRYYWRVRSCVGAVCSSYGRPWVVHAARTRGDVNGDGYGDVVMGSPSNNNGKGTIRVYFGGPTGSIDATADLSADAPDLFYFGFDVATGDMNGDGFADIFVAYYLNNPLTAGEVWVFAGGGTLSSTPTAKLAGSATSDVVASGDVNGDGFDDVAVVSTSGDVKIFLGKQSSFDTISDQTSTLFSSAGSMQAQGRAAAIVGDMNGDGRAELMVGLPSDKTAKVYLGTDTGIALTPAVTYVGSASEPFFGTRVASAGDTNGDGLDDVIVGGANFSSSPDAGFFRVYVGSRSPLSAASVLNVAGASNEALGMAACGGDFNRDGYSDLVVGAPSSDVGATDAGRAYAFFANPLDAVVNGTLTGGTTSLRRGFDCAIKDVNGDGFADLLLGEISNAAAQIVLFLGGTGTSLTSTASQTFSLSTPAGGPIDTRWIAVD